MPEAQTIRRAREDAREGKAPTTQAGEFVREEIRHIRQGKHGARSTKQAIAIALSKARRAGVPLKPPAKGKTSPRTRQRAERDYEIGQGRRRTRSSRRQTEARINVLRREPRSVASHRALSRQARQSARRRSATAPSSASRKAGRARE